MALANIELTVRYYDNTKIKISAFNENKLKKISTKGVYETAIINDWDNIEKEISPLLNMLIMTKQLEMNQQIFVKEIEIDCGIATSSDISHQVYSSGSYNRPHSDRFDESGSYYDNTLYKNAGMGAINATELSYVYIKRLQKKLLKLQQIRTKKML